MLGFEAYIARLDRWMSVKFRRRAIMEVHQLMSLEEVSIDSYVRLKMLKSLSKLYFQNCAGSR